MLPASVCQLVASFCNTAGHFRLGRACQRLRAIVAHQAAWPKHVSLDFAARQLTAARLERALRHMRPRTLSLDGERPIRLRWRATTRERWRRLLAPV